METQATMLNVLTSEKNQEKEQKKIQKRNVLQQQQKNLQRQQIQQYFLREYNNTCQD